MSKNIYTISEKFNLKNLEINLNKTSRRMIEKEMEFNDAYQADYLLQMYVCVTAFGSL